jgi:hypothetical protein
MSSPVGRDDGIDDPLLYVPRWAGPGRRRLSTPPTAPIDGASMDALLTTPIAAPPMAPGIGGPNLELPPRPSLDRARLRAGSSGWRASIRATAAAD